MKTWQKELYKAKIRLTKHDPRGALQLLQAAVEECPPGERRDFARILFYTGAALQKLGHREGALKSWQMAAKMKKYGYGARMIERMTNVYGMEKCCSPDEDDKMAFLSVHMSRYLQAKTMCRFGSQAEMDMVETLIFDAWRELRRSGRLEGLSAARKLKEFKETLIIFPFFECPDDFAFHDNLIVHDFANNRRVTSESTCPCGSGKPYMSCCGRIPSISDLRGGTF